MKQITATAFLLVLITGIYSCSAIKTALKKDIPALDINYDFNNPKIAKAQYAEPGQPINLSLLNINPNIYNVSVSDSVVVYDKQKPDQFENLFNKMPELKPVTGSTDAPPANPAAVGAAPAVLANPAFIRADAEYTRNRTAISTLDNELQNFLTTDYDNVKELFSECVDYSDMPSELNKWAADCSMLPAQRIAKADAYIIDHLFGINPGSIPVGIESFVNNKITALKSTLMVNEEKGNDLIKRYSAIKESVNPSLSIEQYRVIEKNTDEKINKIKTVLENISKMKDKLKDLEKIKPGAAIAEAYKKTVASEINKTVSKYIPKKGGDEYLLKVTIEKKENTGNCKNEPASFTLPVYVEKGVKIDFSTGVVFNFGRNKFFDQQYRYDSVYRPDGTISDSVRISKRTNNNLTQVSIGAFGHVYTRIRRDVNLGGLIGVSLSADQRVYYHFGLSALIGKNDRLAISTGVSVAKAKYLSTQYDENQVMKRSLAPTTIPVEDATRIGFFVGLSYNLNLIK